MTDGLAGRQARFVAHLLGRDDGFEAEIPDGSRAGRAVLLGVYRHAYGARLAEALRSNHPMLHRVLGDAAFAQLGQAYLAAAPSRSFSIRWFGDRLAEFLAATAPWGADPWLAELARFEWALGLCLDGADGAPVAFTDLATTPVSAWPDLRFALIPAAHRLSLDWSVPRTWRALIEGAEPVPRPERQPASVPWLIWRRDLVTVFRSLDPAEAACLDLAAAGAPFADLCAQAGDLHGPDQAALFAAGYLRQWVEDGLLIRVPS